MNKTPLLSQCCPVFDCQCTAPALQAEMHYLPWNTLHQRNVRRPRDVMIVCRTDPCGTHPCRKMYRRDESGNLLRRQICLGQLRACEAGYITAHGVIIIIRLSSSSSSSTAADWTWCDRCRDIGLQVRLSAATLRCVVHHSTVNLQATLLIQSSHRLSL